MKEIYISILITTLINLVRLLEKLLGYISDYLYTDLNIREEELKEINSKFISNPYKFQKKVRINNDLLCRRFTFWSLKYFGI